MTTEQWEAIEKMGERHPVVLVDPAHPVGAVLLTPASFCGICGGDGIDPDSYDQEEFEDCTPCRGRGGLPVTHPPQLVLANGEMQ